MKGYKVYYGTVTKAYTNSIDVGNLTTFTLTGLTQGQTYYIVVTAYDTSFNESGFSIEVYDVAIEPRTLATSPFTHHHPNPHAYTDTNASCRTFTNPNPKPTTPSFSNESSEVLVVEKPQKRL